MNHKTMVTGVRITLLCILIRPSNWTNVEILYLHAYCVFPFASYKTLSVTAEKWRTLACCCGCFACMRVQTLWRRICFWEAGGGSPQNCPSQLYLYFSTWPQLDCSHSPFWQHRLLGTGNPFC